jgi:hypothetical protein
MGQIAMATGASPEATFQWVGAPFAFALVLLVFAACRHFTRRDPHAWWIFGAILLAGGLESVDALLSQSDFFRAIPGDMRVVHRAFNDALFFSSYRGHYVFQTIFDTHYLIIWTFTLGAVLLAYDSLARPSRARLALALAAFGAATLLHIYDGVVLLAIVAGVALVLAAKREPLRDVLALLASGGAVVGVCVVLQMWLWRSSGLPLPGWREVNVLLAVVVAAYPLAWLVVLPRLADLWRRTDLQTAFLFGWAAALTVMTLSGPFYPYPSRGSLTLSVALYLLAGVAWFAGRESVPRWAAVLAVVLIVPNAIFASQQRAESIRFSPEKTHIYTNADMRALIHHLEANAGARDVLLVDRTRMGWATDDRWLAPTYPGRLYCGHFFLTVDFEKKRDESIAFYRASDPAARAAFLRDAGIRWIYAGPEHDVDSIATVPGVELVLASPFGSLLEHRAETP